MFKIARDFYLMYTTYEDFSKSKFRCYFVYYPILIGLLFSFFSGNIIHKIMLENIGNLITIYSIIFGFASTMLGIILSSYKLDEEKLKKLKKIGYFDPEKLIANIKKILLLNTYITLIATIIASVFLFLGYGLLKLYIRDSYLEIISYFIISTGIYFLLVSFYIMIRNLRSFLVYHDKIELNK